MLRAAAFKKCSHLGCLTTKIFTVMNNIIEQVSSLGKFEMNGNELLFRAVRNQVKKSGTGTMEMSRFNEMYAPSTSRLLTKRHE